MSAATPVVPTTVSETLPAFSSFENVVYVSAMPFPCRLHTKDNRKVVLREAAPSKAAFAALGCKSRAIVVGEVEVGVTAFGATVFDWTPPDEEKRRALADEVYGNDLDASNTLVRIFVSIVTDAKLREYMSTPSGTLVSNVLIADMLGLKHVDILIGFADHSKLEFVEYAEGTKTIHSVSATTFVTTYRPL